MSNMKFKIGTDPEVFLSVGDKFVSAAGLFPGTKDKPFKVDKGAVQVDGLALEFNINPAETAEEFDKNISTVLDQMNSMVKKVDKDMKINFVSFARFDIEYFKSIPDDHKILGCNPDFNIKGNMNEPPDIFDRPFRTAAGHLHIGWTGGEDPLGAAHFQDCLTVARRFYEADIFPDRYKDELERIKYYGGDGAFRPKPYGVELRKWSNRWVKASNTRKMMFNSCVSLMNEIAKENR